MALEITVLQGADVFAQIFNAIAAFVRNETWGTLMDIAEVIGLLAAMVLYVKGCDLKSMGMWFLTFMLINTLLLTPKERVIIRDLTQPNIVKNVDNVPLGVAFPIYLTTMVGNAISQAYDNFLSQPDDLQYSKTGLLFGQRLLEESFDIVPPSPELASNISNFVKYCIIERQAISKHLNWADVRNSGNLVTLFDQGRPADFMTYTHKTNGNMEQLSCVQAGALIKNDIQAENNNQHNGTVNAFARKLGFNTMNSTAVAQINSKLANVQNYFMGTSKSAADIFTQNMLVNQVRKAINSYPVNLDVSSALINQTSEQSLTKMKLSHLSSYQVSGRLLPAFHTVLLTLLVGLFPIMVLAMFIRELTWGVVKNYLTVLFSLIMWPVMFAIFNSIMNTLQFQTLNGQAFTLANADSMKENATTMAGVAMWLTTAIPFLSFRLVTSLGQNLASAGSYLGNAMSSSTNADAAQTAMGNYNWANMQTHNINSNKVDMNHLTAMGKTTTQLANGAYDITHADGSAGYDKSTSIPNLPFNVNWGNQVNRSWNDRTGFEIREEARNSQGVRQSITNALAILDGYSSGTNNQNIFAKDRTKADGFSKHDNVGDSVVVQDGDSSSTDMSAGKVSNDNVNAQIQGGAMWFGNGATVGGSSSTGDTASNSEAAQIFKRVEYGLKTGEDWTKLNNFIESVKSGYSNTSFYNTLNSVQNELRQAQERYNDYVETESKSLSNAKESILSNSENVSVTHDLNGLLLKTIREDYTVDQQNAILSAVPTAEGLALRNEAIQKVTNEYIGNIVENHKSGAESVKYGYQNTSISSPTLVSPTSNQAVPIGGETTIVNPSQGGNLNNESGFDFDKEKQRLQQGFDNAKQNAESKQKEATSYNKNAREDIELKEKYTGGAAKTAKDVVREMTKDFRR